MGTPQEVHSLGDALDQIDSVLVDLAERDRSSAAAVTSMVDAQQVFLADFARTCQDEIRPAMEAVLDRLSAGGGGGRIEEHPGGATPLLVRRITLWMSLQGDIVGPARSDRHPYLQFDADPVEQEVRVTEGDMWGGSGAGRSGPAGTWPSSEITREHVITELVAILRRSVPRPDLHPPAGVPDQLISSAASGPPLPDVEPAAQ